MSFTTQQRLNLIADLVSFHIEEHEVGGGGHVDDEELRKTVQDYGNMSDADLRDQWLGTIPEWLSVGTGIPEPPADKPTDEWWEEDVFQTVINGGEKPYGYVSPVTSEDVSEILNR